MGRRHAADDRQALVAHEVESGRRIMEGRLAHLIYELAYSPDGSTIAALVVGDTEGVAVLLVDATTLETVAELAGDMPIDGDADRARLER